MKRLKVGLNGFGRIGRAFTRIATLRDSFDIVHINTRKTPTEMMAYLLKYDSVYRTFDKSITHTENSLVVDGKTIRTTLFDDPTQIPWGESEVDVVIDATGAFKTKEDLSKHLHDGVQKVLLTAPGKEDVCHIVLGVNDPDLSNEQVISNASCTTNCSATLFKVLHDNFTVKTGFLTTAHAYTLSQSLLDDAGKKFDTSRAAALNIIPSTTGAAKAVARVIPELQGKIDGMAIRVPVPTGSFVDITANVEKPTTAEEINAIFKKASETTLKGKLGYTEDVIVSSDIIGSSYSAVFDPHYTTVIDGTFVKIYGWYDNEWGYSTRLVDVVEQLAGSIT
ncbi:MAG: type I glyceraldehyde-3-phosphate dehydrogenase [Weeksellaceae bacterium]